MTSRWAVLLIVFAGWALSAGCATTNENDVSTIPWNRPQSWEGASGFGGFRPPGNGGY
ncbi:MAG: hypothetical protein ABSH21_01155 [Verrucomicrobiia bacterium]|jgi:hypothetical protein